MLKVPQNLKFKWFRLLDSLEIHTKDRAEDRLSVILEELASRFENTQIIQKQAGDYWVELFYQPAFNPESNSKVHDLIINCKAYGHTIKIATRGLEGNFGVLGRKAMVYHNLGDELPLDEFPVYPPISGVPIERQREFGLAAIHYETISIAYNWVRCL